MRSPWTTGGLQREGTAMMTTGRRAMATLAMVIGIKRNFLERGRTAGGVQTGAAGRRVDGTGLSTTEAGLLLDTGVGIVAERGIVTEKVGDPSHLTGTERGHEVGPRAETGNVVAGKRRGTEGRRAPPAQAESAATPRSGAETLRRPSVTERGSERGSESGTERERRRKRRGMKRKRKKSC